MQYVVTYDNGTGYREWASPAQDTPLLAWTAAGLAIDGSVYTSSWGNPADTKVQAVLGDTMLDIDLNGYQKYLDDEWQACEQYSSASGNCAHSWTGYAAETLDEWVEAESKGLPHKSYW